MNEAEDVTKPSGGDLLTCQDVKMHFPLRGGIFRSVTGHVQAVDGVSLQIRKGETLAIVGESGCGKSTLARVLLRLIEPTAGRVVFMGQDLSTLSRREVREGRKHMQMVFQDPMSSLDPRMTIKNTVGEPIAVHGRRERSIELTVLAALVLSGGIVSLGIGLLPLVLPGLVAFLGLGLVTLLLVALGGLGLLCGTGLWQVQHWAWWLTIGLGATSVVMGITFSNIIGIGAGSALLVYLFLVRKHFAGGEELTKQVLELLDLVGLKKEHLNRFPHEFSGGQRQRINIARALALNPDVIILDEPTSALDVSVQAQILNLLMELQRKLGLTYLFITHDLSVVYHIADRVAVMYAGRFVELGETADVFTDPLHPYTKALISAAPVADPTAKIERIVLEGEVPSPIHPPSGCRFHPRCWLAFEPCSATEPQLFEAAAGRMVACFATARDHDLWEIGGPKATAAKVEST